MSKTYVPTLDLHSQFPHLQKQKAVLLHPKRATVSDPKASKFDSRNIAWPRNESWPKCPVHKNDTMIPVLQLRKDTVEELDFPEGKDLFQLLWCPRQDHEDYEDGPVVKTYWRKLDEIGELLEDADVPEMSKDVDEDCIPEECELHPERVEEYPSQFELDDETKESVEEWIKENGKDDVKKCKADESALYATMFAAAPVSKVGGFVSWWEDPVEKECKSCGEKMTHLLTIASKETGGYGRWDLIDAIKSKKGELDHDIALQLGLNVAAPNIALLNLQQAIANMNLQQAMAGFNVGDDDDDDDDEDDDGDDGDYEPYVTHQTDLCLADLGSLYVLVCRKCKDLPIQTVLQYG